MLPVIRLGEILGLESAGAEPERRQPLLVARHPQGEIGLAVDALIGQREVMVRPLPGRVGGHPALHGAAELEGDQVALMIDLARLIGNGRGIETQVG
jgi:chemotaxis protein histidine kinase CheA